MTAGRPLVRVPGVVRLLLEIFLFGAAVGGLYAVDRPGWALLLACLTLLHYALSYDRVLWLLGGAPQA